MPSLIWSHNLSGCPSVTDSEVNSRLGEFMKVLLINASKKELAPSGQERARNERSLELPSHLPDNTSAGVGTLKAISLVQLAFIAGRLPRFQRAGPSTSLDKSALGA